MIRLVARAAILGLALMALRPGVAWGQGARGVVLDQTGLPLPGASVQLLNGSTVVTSTTTRGDGTFTIANALPGTTVLVSLDGFETTRVLRGDAARIVLALAHATETTTVFAPTLTPASPTTSLLGSTLTASTVARLPSSRLKARESLPLLPSVVRGPDGLMQLGGARAHDTPLLLDGFNVTDPASGISSINLPFEAVRGVDVLRDPMAVTYGGLLGGAVHIESRPGGAKSAFGVQGVVPRPRFATPGFGRLEGIFPRAFSSGSGANGRLRYMAAAEYDYERIPVPGVTQGRGPDVVEQSATLFGRFDLQMNAHNDFTVEGLMFPSRTRLLGLSPRRDEEATADLSGEDLFAGATHRYVAGDASVFTIQLGVLAHEATLSPNGSGTSSLSPAGWKGNWFTAVNRNAVRYTATATWERVALVGGRMHDVTLNGEVASRRLRGSVTENAIAVNDAGGRVVRSVEFGPTSTIGVHDRPLALAVRDVWQASQRVQVDGGVRLDHSRHGGAAPSGRVGVRYALDESGLTVVKAGYGRFVGSLPLGVEAFGAYPSRVDRRFDPETGATFSEMTLQPTVGRLRLPRALTATIAIERQLLPGLDAQVGVTDRRSARLATLHVPTESGALAIQSSGSGRYRELQVSVRRTWEHDQQMFVSYVRSSARGDLNDFAALFHALDAPLVQAGGMSRLASDARDRVLTWGTFNLPRKVVISSVVEWRSGFPYSAVDARYLYAGTPNSQAFPAFMATDLVVYKTFTVKKRSADVGTQIFNATNHHNPREVHAVVGAPRRGEFTNSVGPIIRGYMLLKW